jgi:transposase
MARRKNTSKKTVQMVPIIQPDAAGIDIGATEIFVAVPTDRDEKPIQCFATFTEDLHRAAKWLKQCCISSIAMESTGVYWIPIFQILEAYGFEVILVNARHVKQVPGRKTDVKDCQWLQYLHSVGLLKGSFRPEQDICAVRSLLRHRDKLVKLSAAHVQHMQKALAQMNLHLHHVLNDITGVTGMAIIRAILAGERDPRKLVALKNSRVKADDKTIIKSLIGDYREEHLFTLRQSLQIYETYHQLVKECDQTIQNHLERFEPQIDPQLAPIPPSTQIHKKPRGNDPNFDLRSYLYRIIGVDLTQIDGVQATTAHVFFTEVGLNLSAFPTSKHFCAWLGLSPQNKISGGKILSSKTRPGAGRLAQALKMSANSLSRSKSYLGQYYRKMKAKMGAPKAITATAHKISRIIYHMVKYTQPYDETLFFEHQKRDQLKYEKRVRKQAENLGFQLVPIENPV